MLNKSMTAGQRMFWLQKLASSQQVKVSRRQFTSTHGQVDHHHPGGVEHHVEHHDDHGHHQHVDKPDPNHKFIA